MRVVTVCIGNKNVHVDSREEPLFERIGTRNKELVLQGHAQKNPGLLAQELKQKVSGLTPADLTRLKAEGKIACTESEQTVTVSLTEFGLKIAQELRKLER